MSVARMLHVSVIGYLPLLDAVVDRLQRAGVLEVAAGESGEDDPAVPRLGVPEDDARLAELRHCAGEVHFVRDTLAPYRSSDAPFSAFVSEKIHLSEGDFLALKPGFAFQRLYRECLTISDRLASIGRERQRLRELLADLGPWEGLRLEMARWQGTEHTVLFTGTVPSARAVHIRDMVRDAVTEVTVQEVGGSGTSEAWVVIAHEAVAEDVRAALALSEFREVSFPDLRDYPAEEAAIVRDRLAELDADEARCHERLEKLASEHYTEAVALSEAVASRLEAVLVRERFGGTMRTFTATGWAREADREALEAALADLGPDLDVAFREPAEGDSPPVSLENPWFLRPFEVLTDLYGRPSYGELDPTPLLAPFFLLFFGICISDVGYGAMLIAGALLIKRKLDVAPGVRKFMDLLMAGGGMAMVVGVFFGSWFALPLGDPWPIADGVRRVFLALQQLDPMAELPDFLVLCVALGVAQVFFGVIVAAYDAWRKGDAESAVAEQLSTLFLFGMIALAVAVPSLGRWPLVVGLGLTVILQGRALQAARQVEGVAVWDRTLTTTWLAALVAWIAVLAFGGPAWLGWAFLAFTVAGLSAVKGVRRAVVALLGGVYAVYGMSAFIGDILSYTRLAALGLSGALVGMVFNLLAGLVVGGAMGLFRSGGAGVVWGALVFVMAALVFVVGHTFNVVINLLGAFVHPARLQFVEFFSKFYEGGGRAFLPFGYKTKSIVLRPGAAGREGGASS